LLDIVRALRAQGTTIILVSHVLEDVLAVCDTISVLRDGQLVKTAPARTETQRSLVTAMVGRSIDVTFPPKEHPPAGAPVIFEARGITLPHLVSNVSLTVRRGEIVGLAGLIGSGRSETARAIFGAEKLVAGSLWLEGAPIVVKSPRAAIDRGIALLPEDRKQAGLVMGRPLVENVTLPHLEQVSRGGVIDQAREHAMASSVLRRLDVRAGSVRQSVRSLSGGNQQKTLFGKWLFRPPKLLIADEPTRGVDVGAKRAIYELLVSLARQGLGILLISSELEEVIGLAHRIYVMRAGHVVAEVDPDQVGGEHILHLAFGGQDDNAAGRGTTEPSA
jgi:ABC-type sugar transport system ATPase subunit